MESVNWENTYGAMEHQIQNKKYSKTVARTIGKETLLQKAVEANTRRYVDHKKSRWLSRQHKIQRIVVEAVEILAFAGYVAAVVSNNPPQLVLLSSMYFAVCACAILENIFKLEYAWTMTLQIRAESVWKRAYTEKIIEYVSIAATLNESVLENGVGIGDSDW